MPAFLLRKAGSRQALDLGTACKDSCAARTLFRRYVETTPRALKCSFEHFFSLI